MEHESWITDVYKEFWDTADELAEKEIKAKQNGGMFKWKIRERHLEAMKDMFIATMLAPEPIDEDCGGEDVGNCDQCTSLPQCQERWRITKQN